MNRGRILSTSRYLPSFCIHAPTFATSTITLNMPTKTTILLIVKYLHVIICENKGKGLMYKKMILKGPVYEIYIHWTSSDDLKSLRTHNKEGLLGFPKTSYDTSLLVIFPVYMLVWVRLLHLKRPSTEH